MSQITIQCRLVANVSTRHQIWTLMAERNTPLINELLEQIGQHPDFETWRQKRKIPAGIIKQLCEPLRTDSRFIGQPGRFYASASALVDYIYKSWLKVQQRLQRKLEGQMRWLGMLKSDEELVNQSGCTLEVIRTKASEILVPLTSKNESPQPTQTKGKKSKKPQDLGSNRSISKTLFQVYDDIEDLLTKNAICYLLKNGCKIPDQEEDKEKFAKRRRKTEIKISRLEEQLASRIPKGRNLTGEKWLETLIAATSTVPENESQARSWQDRLLTKPQSVPFPVTYESNEDLTWSKNSKGRLCVKFNGLSEHTFQIYCDQRQLKWFQRFLEDQQIKRESKDQHSSSLFTLRSGQIAWALGKGKGDAWNIHHLTLYCTLDTRLWTAEGTEQVRQEKADDIAKTLARMKEKGDLNDKQQAFIKRKNSTLARLNNPFPRPSQPLYQGRSHIAVGISLGLGKPATAAIVDGTTGEAIAYRSIRQLLGDNYKLFNRQRQEKQRQSHQRHKAQKNATSNQFGESELGEYVDRLLAKEIVTLAQTYQAGSIVLPKLGDMRELVHSEIQTRAEQKIPSYVEGQQKYAKQYRVNVHQWSYGRLIENIQVQAAKIGISIEQGQQPVRGSPQEKAKEMAIAAYHSRLNP
ncbi:type V CRISPR-associated protein Cas12k [Allocoleopsis franciscana]|uniref:Uncharacterized protein n=1 Tax=Allocoleopsis franciscana PCC 7113 TaxID=1173027 RepID=K9WL17_9CYAN|nr:type V CRISPR-associated protein Cas12k [Allocoleopsis franciscana]AFZ20479.1 hypothetical protein Mic7113_4810 [Allocoleopsis franciscana PCC 7113]